MKYEREISAGDLVSYLIDKSTQVRTIKIADISANLRLGCVKSNWFVHKQIWNDLGRPVDLLIIITALVSCRGCDL